MKKVFALLFLSLTMLSVNAAVSFSYTSPICGTLTDTFTNTSTGTNIAYLWYFDDPATGVNNFALNATKTSQAHTFSIYGTFNVKLYILDINNNPIDSVTHTIKLIAAPNLFIIPNTFKTYCLGLDSENNFVNATLDPAYKYFWNPTPLWTNATGNSVQYRFVNTQTYSVTVTDTTTGCSNSKSFTVYFVNCASITSQFSFVAPACGVYSVNFKNSSQVAHHYKWYFGDPVSGTSDTLRKFDTTSVTHVFSDTGSFYVSLVAFDSLENKKDSSVKLVKIYKQSQAQIFNNDTTICIRSSVILTGTGLGSAIWSPAAGLNTTTGYATIATPLVTTTYYLTANNNGCVATDSVTIKIQNKPDPNFKTDTLCIGQVYNFSAYDNSFSYYHWDFGTGDTATGFSANYSFDTSGTFKVKLYVIKGACDSFVTKSVLVLSDPIADFSTDKAKAEITKATFQFYNKSYNSTHFLWDFGDFSTSTDVSPVHTYTDTGWYKVLLTAYNSLGCSDTATMLIRVDNVYAYYIPSAFSPNGTGPIVNDVFGVIGPSGITKFEMTIYNRWGEQVYSATSQDAPWDGMGSDGKECAIGNYLYVIKFKDPTGKRLTFRGLVSLVR